MADIADVLLRLSGVKKTGMDSWIAKCPSHQDKSPSLTVKEASGGRILLHCFAGCGTDSVLDAIGLGFADLFAEPLGDFKRERMPVTPTDALRALAREANLIAIAAADMASGKQLDEEDAARVCIAAGRIQTAVEYVYGVA